MRFTLDLLGAELIEIRFNEPNPNHSGPSLGFTTDINQEEQ